MAIEIREKIFPDGSFLVEAREGEPFKTYFDLSEEIRTSKDIYGKLSACEKSFVILPQFVREWLKDSAKLPDTILCRDVGVELYLRLGRWAEARRAVEKISAAGAYPDGGRSALEYVERYTKAAETALDFLRKNTGYPQRKIYKALPDVDGDCLKSFVRSSHLIRKVKAGSTNQLFVLDK